MVRLKESASEIKIELLDKCKTVSDDDEFLKAALSFATTDAVRLATIRFISGEENLTDDDVIIFILHMNQELYGTNDFVKNRIKD